MIGNRDDIGFLQVGGFDDLFEIAVGDLIGAFEILRITLALGAVLEAVWRGSVSENS